MRDGKGPLKSGLIKMRVILLNVVLSSLVISALPLQHSDGVEIFSEGKKYGSIGDYREHQIDKLKSSIPRAPSSTAQAPGVTAEPLEEAVKAFTSRMLGFLFVDEGGLRQALQSAQADQTAAPSADDIEKAKLIKKIKALEGQKN